MDYIMERYELVRDRIREIPNECDGNPELWGFSELAKVALRFSEARELLNTGDGINGQSRDGLRSFFDCLYSNILPGNYETALENPRYAVKMLKRKNGQIQSHLAYRFYADAPDFLSGDLELFTMDAELLVEIYCAAVDIFSESDDIAKARDALYERSVASICSFMNDNALYFARRRAAAYDPESSGSYRKLIGAGLTDLRNLYGYGFFITDRETGLAEFMNSQSRHDVERMAHEMTDGFMRKVLSENGGTKKDGTVLIEYPVGSERMVDLAAEEFEKNGFRVALSPKKTVGCFDSRFLCDHSEDRALYLTTEYCSKSIDALTSAYEEKKDVLKSYVGTCRIEFTGDGKTEPEKSCEALSLTKRQTIIEKDMASRFSELNKKYMPEDPCTFCIFAFPMQKAQRSEADC